MKKLLMAVLLLWSAGMHAQTIAEGNKNLYYQRYHSAVDIFNRLSSQQPGNGEAWLGLATAYLAQNAVPKAANAIANAPAEVQDHPYFRAAKGSLLLAQNKNDSAALFFSQALDQTRQKDAALLQVVAKAHIAWGDASRALELLQQAQRRDKRDAAINTLMGDAYRKLGNSGEAYKQYQAAIAKNDQYARAHYQLGDIFLSQKNADMYVQHFEKALAADPAYAPALEKLYAYEFVRNPQKAKEYYSRYMANSDTSVNNQYDVADLLYINKEYNAAITKAQSLVQQEGASVQPRIYKMIGYSYAGLGDTAKAATFMQQYFEQAPDSILVPQDYVSMSTFLTADSDTANDSLAAAYLARVVDIEKDSAALYKHFQQLAELAKNRKDFGEQAKWMHRYYTGNEKATNLDLFNTGLAYFRAENYGMADSIYGMYVAKYPDQSFGYYWQAKSKALQDPEMKEGLAIPAYQQLITVLKQDTTDANYQKWMVEALGYLAAYEANTEKDYAEAIGYFEQVLEVDPGNADARKYIDILEKDSNSK